MWNNMRKYTLKYKVLYWLKDGGGNIYIQGSLADVNLLIA